MRRLAVLSLICAASAVAAHEGAGGAVIGAPEDRLVDPVGFLQDALGEAEGLEHLHRPAGDAVGLPETEGA